MTVMVWRTFTNLFLNIRLRNLELSQVKCDGSYKHSHLYTLVLGVNGAAISLIPPGCYSEYDFLVTPKDSCNDAINCFNSKELRIHSGQIDKLQHKFSIEIDGLESCSQYRAIYKAKGDSYIFLYLCF